MRSYTGILKSFNRSVMVIMSFVVAISSLTALLPVLSQTAFAAGTTDQPTVTNPVSAVSTVIETYPISGGVSDNSGIVVKVYKDINNNNIIDSLTDTVVDTVTAAPNKTYTVAVPLVLGDNNFLVTAKKANKDESGPVNIPTITRTLIVTPLPPNTPTNLRLNNSEACGYITNVNSITPTWNGVAGAVSYNYKVTLPNGATYGPRNVGNVTSVTGPFGGEGLSTFSVQAVDSSGLTSGWAEPCGVTYDPNAPTVLLNLPVGATVFTAEFSEAVNPIEASTAANYFLSNWPGAGGSGDLAGDVSVSYNPLNHKATITMLNAGWYISPEQQWGVGNIHDLAGNLLVPNPTAQYSTPLVPPTTPGTPITQSPTNNTAPLWTWTASTDEGGSGVKEYHYELTKGADIIASGVTSDTFLITPGLSNETYELRVYAVDNAGNVSSAALGAVTIDTQGPMVSFDGYNGTDTTPLLTGTVVGDVAVVNVSIDGATPQPATIVGDGTWSFPVENALTVGVHTFSVVAKDALDNASPVIEDTFSVVLITTRPTITQLPTPTSVATTTTSTTGQNANGNAIDAEASVLGVSAAKDDESVLGESKTNAAIAPSSQGWQIFGLAWYWWLLILAALAAVIWWLVTRQRRNASEA